jgi:hypothetical protein
MAVTFALAFLVGALPGVGGRPGGHRHRARLHRRGRGLHRRALPPGLQRLGDIAVFIFFGFVAVCGTAYVQAGYVPALAWLAAIPVGTLTTAILVVNNVRDIETDAAAGKRTLAVRLGRTGDRGRVRRPLAAAYAVPVVLVRGRRPLDPWALLPLAQRAPGRDPVPARPGPARPGAQPGLGRHGPAGRVPSAPLRPGHRPGRVAMALSVFAPPPGARPGRPGYRRPYPHLRRARQPRPPPWPGSGTGLAGARPWRSPGRPPHARDAPRPHRPGHPTLLLHPRLTAAERRAMLDDAAPAAIVGRPRWRITTPRRRLPAPTPPASRRRAPARHRPHLRHQRATPGRGPVPRAFAASAAASAANLGWRGRRPLAPPPPRRPRGRAVHRHPLPPGPADRRPGPRCGREPAPPLDAIPATG